MQALHIVQRQKAHPPMKEWACVECPSAEATPLPIIIGPVALRPILPKGLPFITTMLFEITLLICIRAVQEW